MKSVMLRRVWLVLVVLGGIFMSGLNAKIERFDSYKSNDRVALSERLSVNDLKFMGATCKFDGGFKVLSLWQPDISMYSKKSSKFVAIIECGGEDLVYEEIDLGESSVNKLYYFFDTQEDVKTLMAEFEVNLGGNDVRWYCLVKKLDSKLS